MLLLKAITAGTRLINQIEELQVLSQIFNIAFHSVTMMQHMTMSSGAY